MKKSEVAETNYKYPLYLGTCSTYNDNFPAGKPIGQLFFKLLDFKLPVSQEFFLQGK